MEEIKAEYIWIDGHKPTAKLRSKTKIIDGAVNRLNDIHNRLTINLNRLTFILNRQKLISAAARKK